MNARSKPAFAAWKIISTDNIFKKSLKTRNRTIFICRFKQIVRVRISSFRQTAPADCQVNLIILAPPDRTG